MAKKKSVSRKSSSGPDSEAIAGQREGTHTEDGLTSVPDEKHLMAQLRQCGGVCQKVTGRVVGIALKTKRSASALELLPHFPDLKTLNLSNLQVDPTAYEVLGRLRSLEELHIVYCTPLTDVGLAAISRITTLRTLYISLIKPEDVDADSMVHLKKLTELTELCLGSFKFTEQGAEGLRELSHLRRLALDRSLNISFVLRALGHSPSLQELCLYESDATDDDLKMVEGLTNLRELNVNGCHQLTRAACQSIGCLANVERLWLMNTQFDDAGLSHLANLSHLTLLDVRSCPITDAGMAHLGDLEQLKDLSLGHTQVTDAGLRYFAERQGLTLSLYDTAVTEAGVEALRKRYPEIEFYGP